MIKDPEVLEIPEPLLSPGLVALSSVQQGDPHIPLVGLLELEKDAFVELKGRRKEYNLVVRLRDQAVYLVSRTYR